MFELNQTDVCVIANNTQLGDDEPWTSKTRA